MVLSEAQREEERIKEEHERLLNAQIATNQHLRKEVDYYAELANKYEKDNNRLRNDLANQAVLSQYAGQSDLQEKQEISPSKNTESDIPEIDFSNVRIALVGGHSDFQDKIFGRALYCWFTERSCSNFFQRP